MKPLPETDISKLRANIQEVYQKLLDIQSNRKKWSDFTFLFQEFTSILERSGSHAHQGFWEEHRKIKRKIESEELTSAVSNMKDDLEALYRSLFSANLMYGE